MTTSAKPHIVFVCTGNICRSPMAEVIVRAAVEDAGLDDAVEISSCGIGGWHSGQQADRRARAELAAHGYDGESHRAQQLSSSLIDADLLVALDHGHVRDLQAQGADPERIRLLRSFDPDSDPEAIVEDPYYGDAEGFSTTRVQIEAATPGIVDWVREATSLS
ncbi:putative low molecular weight protein-tyrosine-phosphatase [Corynebacterium ciconiae DSM 44920]|uniref:low molecular weight protein-tyrosine-phosphatase n=1 Tax=Corynebacterium ciconiae TaxID=227319 RepID=UPI0003822119|nr:low molecular weight protein-tyrosine-phosphatase [Corynebacterium ciconiae]WKD60704.1 putative low molecular weight protein-tyrosine-phosphatase [Corynebacterium ciconiae DSM 44920]